jgi:hypothetical protein
MASSKPIFGWGGLWQLMSVVRFGLVWPTADRTATRYASCRRTNSVHERIWPYHVSCRGNPPGCDVFNDSPLDAPVEILAAVSPEVGSETQGMGPAGRALLEVWGRARPGHDDWVGGAASGLPLRFVRCMNGCTACETRCQDADNNKTKTLSSPFRCLRGCGTALCGGRRTREGRGTAILCSSSVVVR